MPLSASSLTISGSAEGWQKSLSAAIRDPDVLIDRLDLPESLRDPARQAARLFPLLVPESYLQRMRPGDPTDPLLRQVLPLGEEFEIPPGFEEDALRESDARIAPGLLKKYAGRALMITTGTCAIHCRYCFRRHYPYLDEPRTLSAWEPALSALAADETIREIILSGGDPLILSDRRLGELCGRLEEISHLKRLRVHTRLPIVLPERVTDRLLDLLTGQRLTPIVVVHANHPQEIAGECEAALRRLVRAGLTVLNQAVLLRGVNDTAEVQAELGERLIDLGVLPYYLHQLDRVAGTAHFEVPETAGLALMESLYPRLPGYGIPRYVRETPGEMSKLPVRE